LTMTLLNYDEQIRKASSFADEAPDVAITVTEQKLAESLMEAATEETFDFSRFHDAHTGQLRQLIEAKISGKKIVAVRKKEEPEVINFMDPLRQSIKRVQKGRPEERNGAKKHPRKRTGKAARARGKKKVSYA